jgi:hypothetical protein
VNENYFPALRKNNKEHKAHNIRYSLHHEYGAPQYHPPMPPIKATGGIKQNRRGLPTVTSLSTSGYSGVVRFGQLGGQIRPHHPIAYLNHTTINERP